MRRLSRSLVVAVLLAVALAPSAGRAQFAPCGGDFPWENPEPKPGKPLRFGVAPSGAAGQIGPIPVPHVPDEPKRILSALAALRPKGKPFVAKVFHHLANATPAGDAATAAIVRRYTRAGYLVDLVLRYNPPEGEDVVGFVDWVRRQVRRYAPDRRVIGLQIGNEGNLTFSEDSSDGAFPGRIEAIARGVIAAHRETERLKARHLEIGFNWFYRMDPGNEESFWAGLRDAGGPAFAKAVDWVGVDAYPGTFFPPAVALGMERDFMINAMSFVRDCLMPIPEIGDDVPLHIAENGWPTGPGRPDAMQAAVLENLVRTVHDFRGTYNVSDYRWFTLRDADTASPNFQQHYGLMESDYTPKASYERFRSLLREL